MVAVRRTLSLALVAAATSAPAAAQWGPVTTAAAPTPRAGAMLAFDAFANTMLLFGGNGTNEFWSFGNGAWTQLSPAVLPGPRTRANWGANPLLAEIVLYGGLGGGQFALDETWKWDGVAWQQLAPAATPGGRYRHAMAFDDARQTVVLYGGRYNSWLPNEAKAETWEFANGAWTQVLPNGSPPGLCDAAMAWHAGMGKILLFGGTDNTGTARDETWAYDGLSWVQINATGPHPTARVGAHMAPILNTNHCVLSGGRDPVTMAILNDTWEHDGANWIEVSNVYGGMYPPRADFAMAHDFARNRLVAFGGVIANGSLRDDTWEYGAQFQPFGLGCAGSAGVPGLTMTAAPVLGTAFGARLVNLPATSTFAWVVAGSSRTQTPYGTSLPHLLTYLGMPNCRLYTSGEFIIPLSPLGGAADWTWQLPALSALIGEPWHLQGMSLDLAANPLGLVMSNAATIVLGN